MPDEVPPTLTTVKNNFYHSKLRQLDKMFAGELDFMQSHLHLDAIVMTTDSTEADKYTVDIYEKGYGMAPTKVSIDAYAMSPFDTYALGSPAKCVYRDAVVYLVPTPQLFYLLVSYDGGTEDAPVTFSDAFPVPDGAEPEGSTDSASPSKNSVYGWPCDPSSFVVWADRKKLSKKIRVVLTFPDIPDYAYYNYEPKAWNYLCLRVPTPATSNIVGIVVMGLGNLALKQKFGILDTDWTPGTNTVQLRRCVSGSDTTKLTDIHGVVLPAISSFITYPISSNVPCLQKKVKDSGPYQYTTDSDGNNVLVNPNLWPMPTAAFDVITTHDGLQWVADYPLAKA